MNANGRRLLWAALITASGAGCSWFQDLPIEDLGNTGDGSGLPSPPEEGGGEVDPGFAGHWVGYAEDPFQRAPDGRPATYAFPSGSTDITLDFSFETVFPIANLVFGSGTPPAPETGVSYPPGVDHFRAGQGVPFQAPPVEGYTYHLTETIGRAGDPGKVAVLTYRQFEGFTDWCQLQPALPAASGNFDCAGASGGANQDPRVATPCLVFHPDGTEEAIECSYLALCTSGVCDCSETRCDVNYDNDRLSQVWLEVNGDEIIGTFSGTVLEAGQTAWYMPIGPVHFHRVDPE